MRFDHLFFLSLEAFGHGCPAERELHLPTTRDVCTEIAISRGLLIASRRAIARSRATERALSDALFKSRFGRHLAIQMSISTYAALTDPQILKSILTQNNLLGVCFPTQKESVKNSSSFTRYSISKFLLEHIFAYLIIAYEFNEIH